MKKIYETLKRIIISAFTLFAFNIMIVPLDFVIPINMFTVIFTAFFGILSLPFFSVLLIFFL